MQSPDTTRRPPAPLPPPQPDSTRADSTLLDSTLLDSTHRDPLELSAPDARVPAPGVRGEWTAPPPPASGSAVDAALDVPEELSPVLPETESGEAQGLQRDVILTLPAEEAAELEALESDAPEPPSTAPQAAEVAQVPAEPAAAQSVPQRQRWSLWRALTTARTVHLDGHVETGVEVEARRGVRMGRIAVLPALLYLSIWSLVLLGVWLLVGWGGYAVLDRLGVLESVSRAVATALAQPLPPSGLLPLLEWDRVWPLMVLLGIALSVLWVITTMAFVLIHNAISGIMGGPRVRIGI